MSSTRLLTWLTAASVTAIMAVIPRRRRRAPNGNDDGRAPLDTVDEAIAESFPASDPPAHAVTLGATPPQR